MGYLVQDKNRDKYQLSVAMLTLAYPVLSKNRFRQLAHDRLADLAKVTGCTIALAAANTDHISMVYLDVFSDDKTNMLRMDIGTRVDMARSSIGRVFLAGLDTEKRQTYYQYLEPANGAEWPELRQRINNAIEQIQNRGFCMVDAEWLKNTIGVGAFVLFGKEQHIMALICGAPNFAVSADRMENEYGPRLVHLARQLETMAGGWTLLFDNN